MNDQAGSIVLEAPLYFVHIPKTAGGTLKAIIARAYGKRAMVDAGNYLLNPEQSKQRALARPRSNRITIGHVPLGFFRSSMDERARVITMMREPVERVLSHYFSHVHNRVSIDGKLIQSLGEALGGGLPQLSNLATRFLCDSPEGTIDAEALSQAKQNLRSFAFVGLQERFEESVILLHQVLGLSEVFPYGERRHANEDRPTALDLSGRERQAVIDQNALDLELYETATEVFEAAFRDVRPMVASNLESLRERSLAELREYEASVQKALDFLSRSLAPGETRLVADLIDASAAAGIPLRPFKRAFNQYRYGGRFVVGTVDGQGVFTAAQQKVGLVRLKALVNPLLRRLTDEEPTFEVIYPRQYGIPGPGGED